MLGFLIRLLPFWVREPLLIAVGAVFGVRIMYLAVRDHDRSRPVSARSSSCSPRYASTW